LLSVVTQIDLYGLFKLTQTSNRYIQQQTLIIFSFIHYEVIATT